MLLRLRRRSSFIHGRPSGNVRDSNANALVLGPPTEFACSRRACENSRQSSVVTARERADVFFDDVSECDVLLMFARTYFEQN